MLRPRLEDLVLALCHGILDLDNVTGLRSTRVQTELRGSPLSQLLTVPLRPVHDEHPRLLVKVRKCLFKLSLPTVRGEVETLDSRIHRLCSPMNDELSPIQQDP